MNDIGLLESSNLSHCEGHQGAHFSYAFSKLDAIHEYYKSNFYQENAPVILSDIDVCLLSTSASDYNMKRLKDGFSYAIDYLIEQDVNGDDFVDVIMKISPSVNLHTAQGLVASRLGWLNSGFICLHPSYLEVIIENSMSVVEKMRLHKKYIEQKISHYGDEIVFSALAMSSDFIRLSDFKANRIAVFLWSCPITKTKTPIFSGILNFCFHVHLPAMKWQAKFLDSLRALCFYQCSFLIAFLRF